MCQRVTCSKCGRPSFAGCGMHVESVLRDVPKDQRCKCREQARSAGGTAGSSSSGGFLDKLFGR
jgi:hypothetical protein